MSVPKLANARLLNKSRYFSGMAWDIARPRLCGIYRSLDYRRTERMRDNGCRPMSFGRRLMNSQQISRPLLLCLCVLLFAILPCAWAQKGSAPPTIVFMTDFGTVDDSVAICKGVMYSIAPEARIVDLTHQVTPFSILDGARFLYGATPYYPAGTVFVVVVDRGVGSARKAGVVQVEVTVGKEKITMPFVRTFSDVPLKAPLLYVDSRGHVGLAVNQGSFAATYDIKLPVEVFIPRAKK